MKHFILYFLIFPFCSFGQIHLGFELNEDSTTHYVYIEKTVYNESSFEKMLEELLDNVKFTRKDWDDINFLFFLQIAGGIGLNDDDYQESTERFIDRVNMWIKKHEY